MKAIADLRQIAYDPTYDQPAILRGESVRLNSTFMRAATTKTKRQCKASHYLDELEGIRGQPHRLNRMGS